jgi:hypothetical protein
MKSVVGVVVGGLLACAIACGGGGGSKQAVMPPGKQDTRAELVRLDQAITEQMQQLNEPRPAPPVAACVENCSTQPMAQARNATQPEDPATCAPAKTDTCTQSCTLKTSICENAAKICTLAAELGGNDAFANDWCNRGLASCESAKKRCCNCL